MEKKATIIYDVIAKRSPELPNVILFYDEDRENAIAYMKKYVKKNGFAIMTAQGCFSVGDILLREREATGKELSIVPYCEIFDLMGKRIKKSPERSKKTSKV
ncbi:hypothetical protein L0P73_23105 [[Clostridium] innocuum]|uniref:hypothetical protein n=1 Tax=Clostridium innocuum TaxID=1522 RepID=UPI001EE0B6BC|nr:hypothetical protein [[Clostridium] innocuum]MCG4663471.1 hypothetical protein [[Clostridium] innocuum]